MIKLIPVICWKHWMMTPRAARLKFWLGPLVKISRRADLPVPLRDSTAIASRIPRKVRWTEGSSYGLSSRAQMTARDSVSRPSLASLNMA